MFGAIYARESSSGEKAPPLDEQIARLKQLAASPPPSFWAEFGSPANQTIEIQDSMIYSDLAITGTTDQRPGYQAMLRAAEAQKFRVLLVWSRDRVMRETEYMLRFIRVMKKLAIKVYDVDDARFIQDATRTDRMENVVRAFVAEDFAKATGEKVRRVYQLKSQLAAQNNERVAWANSYPIELVRKALELRRQGLTIREIADRLPAYKKKKYDRAGKLVREWELKPRKTWVAAMLHANALEGAAASATCAAPPATPLRAEHN